MVTDFLIDEKNSMLEAMELLEKLENKTLFVVENKKLLASITDGDIRRWILKKGNLDAKVTDIANYNPKYVFEKDAINHIEYMQRNDIDAIPILDSKKNIVSISFLHSKDVKIQKKLNIPIVIMAGGLGTRLYPYTKILPKPLIPIGDIPISEHIINRFNEYGCNEFYLIINHKKNMIKAYYNEIDRDYDVFYIDEDKPLGTGGGLSLLKGKIDETFILSNCDILIQEDYEKMYAHHKKEKNTITMVCSLKNIKIPYGVIEIDSMGGIESMQEKPELSFFTNTGMYIVEPEIIEGLEEGVSIGFPDIIKKCQKKGYKVGVYPIGEKSWLDMGQLEEMEKMRKRLEKNV